MTSRTGTRKPQSPKVARAQGSSSESGGAARHLKVVAPAMPQGDGAERQDIPGTVIFDGHQAMKGYALNKMCFSFNSAKNREEFKRDEEAYCRKYNLSPEQTAAIKSRNVLKLLEAGGNIYYLAKFAGIFGLNVQDIGAQQTGMTVEAFKAMLAAHGKEGN